MLRSSRYLTHALLPLALMVGSHPVCADVVERIVVKVNGEILTNRDLIQRELGVLRQRDASIRVEELTGDPDIQVELAEVLPQVLLAAVDELLLVGRARVLGYALDEQQFENIVQNMRKDGSGQV